MRLWVIILAMTVAGKRPFGPGQDVPEAKTAKAEWKFNYNDQIDTKDYRPMF